jgi:hypothetical protein
MGTAPRRDTLIAACAFVLAFVGVLVAEWRHAARTPPATEHAKPATEPLPDVEGATKGPSVSPEAVAQFESSAPAAEPTRVKPVVIAVVKPWIEIARMPPYVRASAAERMAIRDLYWRICVEEKIPLEQRTIAYSDFVQKWASSESGAPAYPSATSAAQLSPEQQASVPSPVDAETMRRLCKT